jgi:hypothetical protein
MSMPEVSSWSCKAEQIAALTDEWQLLGKLPGDENSGTRNNQFESLVYEGIAERKTLPITIDGQVRGSQIFYRLAPRVGPFPAEPPSGSPEALRCCYPCRQGEPCRYPCECAECQAAYAAGAIVPAGVTVEPEAVAQAAETIRPQLSALADETLKCSILEEAVSTKERERKAAVDALETSRLLAGRLADALVAAKSLAEWVLDHPAGQPMGVTLPGMAADLLPTIEAALHAAGRRS